MKTAQILATLFGAFGKAKETDQITIYTKVLDGKIPPALLEKAVTRAIYECRFLPSVAEILALAESLNAEVNPAAKVASWDEAWGEIERKMHSTGWGQDPHWSTPEIEETMKSFGGLTALQMAPEGSLSTNRAHIRQLYESVCSRTRDKAHNQFILGHNPVGILGIAKTIVKEIPRA